MKRKKIIKNFTANWDLISKCLIDLLIEIHFPWKRTFYTCTLRTQSEWFFRENELFWIFCKLHKKNPFFMKLSKICTLIFRENKLLFQCNMISRYFWIDWFCTVWKILYQSPKKKEISWNQPFRKNVAFTKFCVILERISLISTALCGIIVLFRYFDFPWNCPAKIAKLIDFTNFLIWFHPFFPISLSPFFVTEFLHDFQIWAVFLYRTNDQLSMKNV